MSWKVSGHLVAQGGFLELLDFWTWLGWTLLLQLDVHEQSTNLTVQ